MKNMKQLLLIASILLCISKSQAQQTEQWRDYVDEFTEYIDDDDQMDALYSELSQLADNPLNLNTVDAEMLKQLPFLSNTQIEAILNYLKWYGPMVSIYELKNVDYIDSQTIELLSAFVYVGELQERKRPLKVKNLKYARHEWIARYDQVLQQKQGYRSQPDSVLDKYPNRKYLGEPFYNSFKYTFSYYKQLQAGFTAEKDAGEPFLNKQHTGYDFYSAHLIVKDLGILKTFVVGDYKLSFGQGLVASHDFSPGRSAFLSQAERRNHGFRKHASTGEVNFFRGVAATVQLGKFDVSAFYSARKLDATVADEQIISFKTDGLHRVPSDLEKLRTVNAKAYGANARYFYNSLSLGITALRYDYGGLYVNPNPAPYNKFYFRGKQNVNASFDYSWKFSKITVFGETAHSQNGAVATLNALQWTPKSEFSGLVLYRHYPRDYQAVYASAFSQASLVQNEQGLYLGVQFTPLAHWKVAAYRDEFKFPWLRFAADAPSSGSEYMLQIDCSKFYHLNSYLRMNYKRAEESRTPTGETDSRLLPYDKYRLRWQVAWNVSDVWTVKGSVDAVFYDETLGKKSLGKNVSQNTSWKPQHLPIQLDIFLALFETDDYDTRISSYEKKMPYTYNTLYLYGKGLRSTAIIRYKPESKFSMTLKFAWDHHFKGDSFGSGLETIEKNNKTDVNFVIQYKL